MATASLRYLCGLYYIVFKQLTTSRWSREVLRSHFTGEGLRHTQRDEVTWPKSQRKAVAKQGLEPESPKPGLNSNPEPAFLSISPGKRKERQDHAFLLLWLRSQNPHSQNLISEEGTADTVTLCNSRMLAPSGACPSSYWPMFPIGRWSQAQWWRSFCQPVFFPICCHISYSLHLVMTVSINDTRSDQVHSLTACWLSWLRLGLGSIKSWAP